MKKTTKGTTPTTDGPPRATERLKTRPPFEALNGFWVQATNTGWTVFEYEEMGGGKLRSVNHSYHRTPGQALEEVRDRVVKWQSKWDDVSGLIRAYREAADLLRPVLDAIKEVDQ